MADDYNTLVANAKMAGQRETADKFYSTSPSTKPVTELRRFKGSDNYEYAAMSDGSYKITKSPISRGGQFLGPGSEAHKAVAKEDPEADFLKSTPTSRIKIEPEEILKSTPASQITRERSEYPTGRKTFAGGVPDTRDYMSNMLQYDRNAAKNWFTSEGGLDPENAENTVTAMERAYTRSMDGGKKDVAEQYKKTLQELAKLGKGGSTGVSGASYEGE